jgi:dihydrofolate reductase
MMRKVVLQEFVSLDGLAAGPNDSVDFIPASMQGDRSFGREQVALMSSMDTLLLGRVTYEMFAGYWPNVTQGEEQPFADKFNSLAKVVFSKTLGHAPWGKWSAGRIVRESPVDEVGKLKHQPGKDMLVSGSISVAQSLVDHGLVDEVRLVMCPVVLRSGRPLFRDKVGPIEMRLVTAKALDRGAVSLVYTRRDAAG